MYMAETRYAIEYEEYRETKQQIWCRVRTGLLKAVENVGPCEQRQREQREEVQERRHKLWTVNRKVDFGNFLSSKFVIDRFPIGLLIR